MDTSKYGSHAYLRVDLFVVYHDEVFNKLMSSFLLLHFNQNNFLKCFDLITICWSNYIGTILKSAYEKAFLNVKQVFFFWKVGIDW